MVEHVGRSDHEGLALDVAGHGRGGGLNLSHALSLAQLADALLQ
ncbi:hypothetical protein ABIC70_005647 [Methylobacterium sp. 1973]